MRTIHLACMLLCITASAQAQDCLNVDIRNQAISAFNKIDQFTKDHGQLVDIINIRNPNPKPLGTMTACAGTYVFKDGTSQNMSFNFMTEAQGKAFKQTNEESQNKQRADASAKMAPILKANDEAINKCIQDNFVSRAIPQDYSGQFYEACARMLPAPKAN